MLRDTVVVVVGTEKSKTFMKMKQVRWKDANVDALSTSHVTDEYDRSHLLDIL